MRGRGEGKRAAWEGKEEVRGARGWGPGRRERASGGRGGGWPERRIGAGQQHRLQRALFYLPPLCCLSPSRLVFPLFSARAWSPRRCVTASPAGAGGEATAKLSAELHRVARPGLLRGLANRGRERATDSGGQTWAASTPSILPLQPVFSCSAPAIFFPRRTPSPVLVGKRWSPELRHPRRDWGRGGLLVLVSSANNS